uniref:FRIGIDA-like protein n=1 Tax=Hordeum vulgare subsp. vulgare TaxID=112509 RepID=A0A8I7BGY1_HORVV
MCPNYKCAPNQIVLAKKSLSKAAKDKLKEYDFGVFLDMKLKSLENTKLLMFLMDRLDPSTLTLEIAIDKRLKITTHSIQCVLGLPDRGTNIDVPSKHIQKKALCKLERKLGVDKSEDVKVQDLIAQIEKDGEGDDFTIRCFVMILLNKLLLPGTCDYITGKEAALTEDISKLRLINWAQLIFDGIVNACKSWHSKKTNTTSPSIHGCVLFLVVSIVRNKQLVFP